LLVLLCLYGLLTTVILKKSNGVPYISDNVETYSTHIHARNLSQRGLRHSLGLTDETYASSERSPSVVYTHQGNFPRLYVFLLNSLGITTVRGEIVATLVTVGLATIVLAFIVLLRATDLSYAFMALVCLITNYVFFVQWQFDTYRIWHGFFTFSVLLCAHEVARGQRRGWFLVCAMTFALGFYFESIFALFLALLYAAYVLVHAWPISQRVRVGLLGGAAGALIGAGALAAQVVGYLGWTGFLRDLYYTYSIRNHSSAAYTEQLALLESFYREHSVVYWYINQMDTSRLMRPEKLVATHLRTIVPLVPPVLIVVTGLVLGGWASFAGLRFLSDAKPVRALGQWVYGEDRVSHTIVIPAILWLMALAAPLVALPVWALTLSARSTPLVFVSFLPMTFLALSLALRPRRSLEWLRRCSEAEKGGRHVIEPLVRAILAIGLLILAPLLAIAIVSWSWPEHPLSEILHLSRVYRACVVLAVGALALGWWRRARLAIAFRRFIAGMDEREAKIPSVTKKAAGGVALLGMYGLVLTPILCNWLPQSALPSLLCLPLAASMALFAYGRIERQAHSQRPSYPALELGLVSGAWLIASPLIAMTLVLAVVSGRSSFASVYVGCLLAFGAMLAPRGLKFLRATALLLNEHLRKEPNEVLSVARSVIGRALLLMLLALPGALLHRSDNLTVLGRYSVGHFMVLTGYLLYAVLLSVAYAATFFAGPWMTGGPSWYSVTLARAARVVWNNILGPTKAFVLGILLVGSGTRLLAGAWEFMSAGQPGTSQSGVVVVRLASVIVAVLVTLLATKRVTGSVLGFAKLKTLNVFVVSAFALEMHGISARHAELFGSGAVELWGLMANGGLPLWVCWGLVALSLWLMLEIGLDGFVLQEPGGTRHALRRIGMLLLCGVGAYMLVLVFAPGYVISAYLLRWAFFPAFLLILAFAMVCYTLLQVGRALAFGWGGEWRHLHCVEGSAARVLSGIACLVLLVAVLGVYGRTQITMAKLLPSTHYSFLEMLGEEPYKGASFVVDNYAGPVASYTGEWAYFDPRFSEGDVRLGPTGFVVMRDMRHLWSSDRLTNASYTKPKYFLCMRPQTPVIAAMVRNSRGDSYGCERSPLAIRALADDGGPLQNRVVARDDVQNSWMIIQLDWEFPPYLVTYKGTNKWLRVTVDRGHRNEEGTEVRVEYQYAQQEGEAEADTELRVYEVASSRPCEPRQGRGAVLASAIGVRQVALPASFFGDIVVSVTPRSQKKRGFE